MAMEILIGHPEELQHRLRQPSDLRIMRGFRNAESLGTTELFSSDILSNTSINTRIANLK